MSKAKRVGYVRVSSLDQNTERQLEGIETDKLFTDKASGKDTKRPQLQAALDYVREGDVLVVHSMDRLARNTEDLLRMVRELKERHVSVQFVKEGITFSGTTENPMDQLMMTLLGGVATFERTLILERQREGIALAKAKGVYTGRKPSLNAEQVITLRERAASGEAKATIARDLGISRETLYQYLKQEAKAA
jgi:DNA invertase Pin-like site-specific DNA recombinase